MESFWPYLAGFFDGDGSIHFQIVRQTEYRWGFYIRASLVFYQATEAKGGLMEIRRRLDMGRLRDRSGGMSDLTITNRRAIQGLLQRMAPYVIFKRRHVDAALELLGRLPPPRDPMGFLEICQAVDDFASLNFSKSRTVTTATVREAFERHGYIGPRND